MARPVNERRRAELLEAVVDYAIAHGISDLSLRPLAAAVGVTPTTLAHHFGGKEALLGAVLNRVRERIVAAVEPAGLDGTWRWIADERHLPLFRLFFEIYGRALQEPERFAPFLERVVDEWLGVLGAGLEADGVPAADARRRATLGIAVARGLLLDLLTTGDRARVEDALGAYVATGL